MAKYVIPFNGELDVEAETIEEAQRIAYAWRKFVIQSLRDKLSELNLQKVSLKPMLEIIEVDDAWLENRKLRQRWKKEWEYVVHRIAVKPVPETADEDTEQNDSQTGHH